VGRDHARPELATARTVSIRSAWARAVRGTQKNNVLGRDRDAKGRKQYLRLSNYERIFSQVRSGQAHSSAISAGKRNGLRRS
jgi:hypothetical protein